MVAKDAAMTDAPAAEKKDVEMKDGEAAAAPEDPAEAMAKAIAKNIGFIERAVNGSQSRFLMRALRQNTPIRKKIDAAALGAALVAHAPAGALRAAALEAIGAPAAPAGGGAAEAKMDVEGDEHETTAGEKAAPLPEVEIYVLTLAVSVLARDGDFEKAGALAAAMLPRLRAVQREGLRRSVDPLAAKVYFYFALCNEKLGRFEYVKPALFAAHRTSCLQHNEFSAAVLLNALLRGMLAGNHVEAALKLVSKTTFPEAASNNQFCRYLYYTGRIQALQLDYTDAYTKLMQSARKAPANTALGFRREVQKLTVLVQLLMGEIPDRSAFEGPGMAGPLEPYLKLTQAVRRGDLAAYNAIVAKFGDRFDADRTKTLVVRLSQNVVKTGLRRINVSYSRISLEDVRAKLSLDSVRSAEFVCAKAIKDGVIDAVIDHDAGCVSSNEVADIYNTIEPQKAFHRRIVFCLDVHNEALKAMQYPPDAHKPKKKEADGEEAKDDDETKQTDEEIAKEIEEELGDDL